VYRLKRAHPELFVSINGGIKTFEDIDEHRPHVDEVMIGRAAYDDPYLFAEVDRRYYGASTPVPTRHQIVESMYPYIDRIIAEGGRLHQVTRHMLGLFTGQRGARAFKRHLSENATKKTATTATLADALAKVPVEVAA
jgi:tRNA-dihydrouridine synthase A